MLKLGVKGCIHLGYRTASPRRVNGVPIREIDGHVAHRLIVDQMIAAGVDLAFDGGDLFHHSAPTGRSRRVAAQHDKLLRDAGIETFYNSGNHDVSVGESETPTILLAWEDGNGVCVGLETGRGPKEGRYEKLSYEGVTLHVVSHEGLSIVAQQADPFEIEPDKGVHNILLSHGAFSAAKDWYGAADPHGDQYAIPKEWARSVDLMALSHYHQMEQVNWKGDETEESERCPVWWTGSALRRGFSDDPSPRGWLLITEQDGELDVAPQEIWQRPQWELPGIDASRFAPLEVVDQIEANLAAVDWYDEVSYEMTGHGGPILRQTITNLDAAHRGMVGAHSNRIEAAASEAAEWSLKLGGKQSMSKVGASVSAQVEALASPLDKWDGMRKELGEMIHERVRDVALGSARKRIVETTTL